MSDIQTLKSQLRSHWKLLAVSTPFVLASFALAGAIASSMVAPPPTSRLYELSRQLEAARTGALSEQQARTLDHAAANLQAAQRAIRSEGERAWRLRSYERARDLLWKSERLLQQAAESPRTQDPTQPVPAG